MTENWKPIPGFAGHEVSDRGGMRMVTERWLPVLGFEDLYEVSDQGNVRSLDRWVDTVSRWGPIRSLRPGRIMSPNIKRGYRRVTLQENGIRYPFAISHLVLTAFDRPRPDGMIALRWNDVPGDDRLENLYWATYSTSEHNKVAKGHNPEANKTRCSQGHEYTEANTRRYRGKRYCRKCNRILQRDYKDRRRQQKMLEGVS